MKRRLVLDAFDYHEMLTEAQRVDAYAYVRGVAPEQDTLTVEVLNEGHVRLVTIRRGSQPEIVYSGCHDVTLVGEAVYTSERPPRCMLDAMRLVTSWDYDGHACSR